MRVWAMYAAAGLLLTAAAAGAASLLVAPESVPAIWFAAGLAYLLQLAAFGAMVAVRHRNDLFLMGWLAGLGIRFLAVAVVALWLRRNPVLPIEPALLSLVAFVFMLLMLEPVFLRRGMQTR
jgi:hypothetical protein